jgi:hypothetical protein
MKAHPKPLKSTREIFRMPLLIGIVSTIGLVSALLGDGIWDALSWAALGFPVAAALYCPTRRS